MSIVTLPLRGLWLVVERVAREAERALDDEGALRAELARLYQALQSGALAERDFEAREATLAERLARIARRRRRARAL